MAELLTLVASKWIWNIGFGGDKGVITNLHLFWVGGAVESEAQNAMWAEFLDAYYSLWCKIFKKLFFGFVLDVPGDDDRFELVQGSVGSGGNTSSEDLSRLSHGVALLFAPHLRQVVARRKRRTLSQ